MSWSSTVRLGITQRVFDAVEYRERRDALAHDWQDILLEWGAVPTLIPNWWPYPHQLLQEARCNALLFTGGNTPKLPSGQPQRDASRERDETERELIRLALEQNLPIVGVCRGAQLLNLHFGGRLEVAPQPESHVGCVHHVHLSEWVGVTRAAVNSYHSWSIPSQGLSPELVGFAWAGDGTVEGFHHPDLPILGVMWHPERDGPSSPAIENLYGRVLRGERPWKTPPPTPGEETSA